MKSCLSEKALVLLHGDEGSEGDRAHLESCLSCARRYRELSTELTTIVAALKQQPPPLSRRSRPSYSRMGWSLAAAAIVMAFLCGRITAFGVSGKGGVSVEVPGDPDSIDSSDPSIQWMEARNTAVDNPASYALYINELLAQDDSDQNSVVAEGNGDADSDEM
jgi:hypothetical protein